MAACRQQGRRRTLVLASLPESCVVCRGRRWVHHLGAGPERCPHCIGGIPVVHLPMRTDDPEDAA